VLLIERQLESRAKLAGYSAQVERAFAITKVTLVPDRVGLKCKVFEEMLDIESEAFEKAITYVDKVRLETEWESGNEMLDM